MNVLLVSFSLTAPYRVLRCAALARLRPFVLGSAAARGLLRSRYCTGFIQLPGDGELPAADLAAEIDHAMRRFACEIVLPSDHQSFRRVSQAKPAIRAPVFPLPDIEEFDVLNNKGLFARHCHRLGIPCPRSEVMESRAALGQALAAGSIAPPLVVKPLDLQDGEGIQVLRTAADTAKLDRIDYAPILVQDFVAGRDVDATVFAHQGKVVVGQTYHRDGLRLVFDHNATLLGQATRLVEALAVDGIFNFDARVAADGGCVYMLECNPRVFYSLDYAALAGVNYIELGVRPTSIAAARTAADGELSFWPPFVTLRRLFAMKRSSAADRRMLRYLLADPLFPLIYEQFTWRPQICVRLARAAVRDRRCPSGDDLREGAGAAGRPSQAGTDSGIVD